MKSQYVIVRTYSAGVFAGEISEEKTEGGQKEVTMNNCRRLWYWDGAASLSQIAVEGVSKPKNCKFSVPTNGHRIMGVIEIIPASAKAIESIQGVKEWTA